MTQTSASIAEPITNSNKNKSVLIKARSLSALSKAEPGTSADKPNFGSSLNKPMSSFDKPDDKFLKYLNERRNALTKCLRNCKTIPKTKDRGMFLG